MEKSEAKKIMERNVGKGKVIILRDPVQVEGGWEIRFEENSKLQHLRCKDYEEAQEFCLFFGGNNILTIAAPMELNDFKNWSYDKLFNMGHVVKEIGLMQSTCESDQERKVPYVLPTDCGTATLPGSNRKDRNVTFHEIIKSEGYVLKKTVCFTEPMQIENFKNWLYGNFPNHKFMVESFVSQNHETSDYCKFQKKKVGDSTKRMELKLVKLNGEDYRKCRIKKIMAAADGLAEHECKIVILEKQSLHLEDHCGFYLGL